MRSVQVIHSISPFRPFHVVILGAGLSGLVAAYTIKKNLKWPCKVTLLEKSNRPGGWIHSDRFSTGGIFERGTRSIRPVGKVGRNTLKLISDLGLEDRIITASRDASKRRYIFVNGKVLELPSGLSGLIRKVTPIRSSLLPKLLKEITVERGSGDETVHDFFVRRFGKEVAQYLGDAFCLGIYGCSSKKLSIKACFPAVWQNEQEYGSVVLGAILSPAEKEENYTHPLSERARAEGWNSWSLRNGLGELPAKMYHILKNDKNIDIQLSTTCESLHLTPNRQWLCVTKNQQLLADYVISSVPSFSLASMLKKGHPTLANILRQIKWTTLGVANVEYDKNVVDSEGFGILVPGCEDRAALGIVYDSMVFPSQNKDQNSTRLTVMLGGDRYNSIFGHPKDFDSSIMHAVALQELKDILGVSEQPSNSIAYVNTNCIPQYSIGHLDIVNRLQRVINSNGIPITLTGNSYRGVSVNDIIYNTQEEVNDFIGRINNQQVELSLGCF